MIIHSAPPFTDSIVQETGKVHEPMVEWGITTGKRSLLLYNGCKPVARGAGACYNEKNVQEEVYEIFMRDFVNLNEGATDVIFDGDTGGKVEHFGFTVRTLERLGISCVIIEDKVGLKQNSLFPLRSMCHLNQHKLYGT